MLGLAIALSLLLVLRAITARATQWMRAQVGRPRGVWRMSGGLLAIAFVGTGAAHGAAALAAALRIG